MKIKFLKYLLIINSFLFPTNIFCQGIIINEISSSNLSLNRDEDGEYGDWIELFNSAGAAINLEGYGLTDDSTDLFRWIFPDVTMQAGEYLLVWATGKDRRPGDSDWTNGLMRETFTDIPGASLDDLISHPDFPDNPHKKYMIYDRFESPVNIGDDYGQRIHGYVLPPITGYYRFWISGDNNCELFLSTDDIPDKAIKIAEVPVWTNLREWNRYSSQTSSSFYLKQGEYYYISALMKEGGGRDHLSVRWQLPNDAVEEPIPSSRIFVKNSELHTNFKIKSSGEEIVLTNSNGVRIDYLQAVEISTDLSYGRLPNGSDNLVYFHTPSPRGENQNKVFSGRCEKPEFSHSEGFYSGWINIALSATIPDGSIFYTLDSSEPTKESIPYTEPIQIMDDATIRARSYSPDLMHSQIATKSFFIDEKFTFPLISITTDPENLYDQDFGLFPYSNPYWESNLFQDWERPTNIQFFEPDQEFGFNIDAAIKVHGGLTRGNPAKSLAIMTRDLYGESKIEYKLFEDKSLTTYNNFVIRNSGNDCYFTMFRDCFMQSIVRNEMDLDLSASRPAIVYLNGKYWGIRNMREKLNEHFVANNNNIEPNNIDLLEYVHYSNEVQVAHGSAESFNELINYIRLNDLNNEGHYYYVKSQIDIQNYIEYQMAQIFYDNADWPGNNIKWWRQTYPKGKWRWILFDTDFGFGLNPSGTGTSDEYLHYKHNTLRNATASVGDDRNPHPTSTFLFRNLLRNQTFRYGFINTFCDHLNTSFQPERVNSIINSYRELFQPEIGRHHQAFPLSTNWLSNIEELSIFADKRAPYVYSHLMAKFGLDEARTISLNVADTLMGDIGINSIECSSYPWNGKYFPNIPVEVRAIPKPGYTFSHWSDSEQSMTREINVRDINNLTVYFEASPLDPYDIMINEINYISSSGFSTGDWVEIYNNSNTTADLSNWIFRDEDDNHQYTIPENTYLSSKGALVLCSDIKSFKSFQTDLMNLSGDLTFGFSSSGELLRLYDSNNNLIDFVNYKAISPWPDLLGKEGKTIELINPENDNSLAENWRISDQIGGSPGEDNSTQLNIPKLTDISWGLSQNYPNPFYQQTSINYTIAESSDVKIDIFSLSGQIVKRLVNGEHSPGSYSCSWNGRSDTGDLVEGGIYFYQISTSAYQKTMKMILMR